MSSGHCFAKNTVAIVALTLSLISNTMAASFSCKKAITNVEMMICGDDELSNLDEVMNKSYAAALKKNHINNNITTDQKKWLIDERDACQDIECLKRVYKNRIDFLNALSSNRIVVLGGLSSETHNQQLHFGSPVKAAPDLSDEFMPLSTTRPPRDLAEGAEVIVVSGYEPSNQNKVGSEVKVDIDRPGSRVLLILSSYEKINWQVSASKKTKINGILISGVKSSSVTTSIQTRGFRLDLPYAYKAESANFNNLLNKLYGMFSIEKIDVFRGSYSIPSVVTVASLDQPDVALTKDGSIPQRPRKNFTFEITGTGSINQVWSLTGQEGEHAYAGNVFPNGAKSRLDREEIPSILMAGKSLQTKYGNTVYRLHGDNLEIYKQDKGINETEPLPTNFPAFSWPAGIAYDSTRDIVSITTFGGEGFLYRFDANTKQWIDFRSLNNVDICSLSYDKSTDQYLAWGAFVSDGQMIFISGEGEALFARKVLPKLAGIGRLYDSGNGISPCLKIFPNGNDVAVVFMSGNVVNAIWAYYVDNDTATLTYKRN